MLKILSRDAILDLPAFMSLKKALVLLFREPKDLSTPLLSPNAPRQCSIPSSRKAHEYRGPPSTTNRSRFVRAPSTRLRKRRASVELLDQWTTGQHRLHRGELPRIDIYRGPGADLPGRPPSPRSRPPRSASSPSAVWSTRPTRARGPSPAPTSGTASSRSDPPIASTIPQDDRPAMWRWSACAFSQMGILLLEYTEGADHPLQFPYGLKWKGTSMYMGAGGGGVPALVPGVHRNTPICTRVPGPARFPVTV